MKEPNKQYLWIGLVITATGFLSWLVWLGIIREYYTFQKLDLPNGKRLVISSDTWSEINQIFYYHLENDGNPINRVSFGGAVIGEDVKFKTIIGDNGSIVAIVEEYRPDILLAVIDMKGSRSEADGAAILERETGRKYILGSEYRYNWDQIEAKLPRVSN